MKKPVKKTLTLTKSFLIPTNKMMIYKIAKIFQTRTMLKTLTWRILATSAIYKMRIKERRKKTKNRGARSEQDPRRI